MNQLLLTGGAVFDGSETLLDAHDVLIEGDTITRIAPTAEFDGFTGRTFAADGLTILPGLIDCHVHLVYSGEPNPSAALATLTAGKITMKALDSAQAALAGGITAVRDCGGKDYLEFAVRDACNAGRQIGPTIRASGRVICMTGGHGNANGRIADGCDEVVKAVREQIHAGCDLVKIMATGGVMTPGVNPEDAHYSVEELTAGVAEGHRFHRTCASHAQGEGGILNAVRAGVDSIEHGIYLTDECIDEMLRAGTYLVPTLAAVANILAHKDKGVPSWVVEKCERVVDRHRQSIALFHKAGGLIAMGTDAGTPFNFHGDNALELEYMTDLGISAVDALRFSTRNGAQLMGLDKHGEVRERWTADLLLVRGNPLQGIERVSRKANHELVIKAGRVVHSRSGETGTHIQIAAE
jgi:imidazolonepropionase-like amidohydrolase